METLRTPDVCFANLPGFPFAPHYTDAADGRARPAASRGSV